METSFPRHENLYKGNLHSHSTRSDGAYAPQVLIEGYKRQDYHFRSGENHRVKSIAFVCYPTDGYNAYSKDGEEIQKLHLKQKWEQNICVLR